jgi:hypothetical protein
VGRHLDPAPGGPAPEPADNRRMAKLYHFTAAEYLPAIQAEGLWKGGVPVATEPEVRFNKNRGGVGLLAGDECTG